MGSPSSIPPATLLAGKIRLVQRIGRGGMGDVWMARNEATHAEVAVKTLQRAERTELHDERFRREARLAATISHRNVVRIFDLIDEEDGTLALVMELLRGNTLEDCMDHRETLTTLQAVAVATAILSALNHVHAKGIVHRDVKPANIFFAVEPDDHVIPKILDFGIAKLPAASTALTIDGSVLGTPHYMAPEQIRGSVEIDGRSDMFSLASVLYEMLTGERPFQRESAAASLAAVLEHEVDPDPRIEPRLWLVIARALGKRPYERYATCAELADALRAAVDATDEDLASALQELRPSTDAIAESEIIKLGGLTSSPPASFGVSRRLGGSPRGTVWALGATALTVFVVTAMVVITRTESPSTNGADRPPPSAEVALLDASAPATPATVASPITSTSVAASASLPPRGKERTSPTARPAPPRPAALPPPSPPSRPAPGGKPVATSPGF